MEVTHQEVMQQVENIHSNRQDLDDGDLRNRIDRFDVFIRKAVPIASIDLGEFSINDETVQDYVQLYRATGSYPPIVFDEVSGSIIDGLHRANALVLCGLTEIEAFVGIAKNLDPTWTEQGEDEDCIDEDDETESEHIIDQRLPRTLWKHG
jgi:hypothetical protein